MTTPHPYPAYKPSGVPWLGDVPQHWDVVRLASVSRPKSVINQESSELLSVYLSLGVIRFSDVAEKRTNPTSQDLSQYQAVDPGDLVLNNQQAWRGSVGVSSLTGIVSPAYLVLSLSSRLDSQYANLLFRDNSMVGQYVICSKGVGTIQRNLYWPHLKRMLALLPPLPEQRAIVRYLDHVDRRIRRYVAAKRKLIALLEEEKQAIVSQAVTRGLDPSVRLKPSGVKWLGDVPEHWEVSRVKTEFLSLNHRRIPLSAVERGAMSMRQYDYYGASGVIDKVEDYLFDDELLLIAEDGANLNLRNLPLAIIARGKFWVNNHAHILKPRRGNLEYLSAVMEGLNYTPWISGAAQPKLTQDRIMSISIAVPPRFEQDEIIARTKAQTSGLTGSIVRARHQIELL